MATKDFSAASNQLIRRIESALEMANEIREEKSRQYSLASLITHHLEKETVEHGTAEILEDRLSDCGQIWRLIETLEAVKNEVAA